MTVLCEKSWWMPRRRVYNLIEISHFSRTVGEENDAANIPAHQVLSGHQLERRESQVFVFFVMSELLPYKANKADLKMKANFQNKDAIGATNNKK
jgi:hypothetical protein